MTNVINISMEDIEQLEEPTAETYIRENIEKANTLLDLALDNIRERGKVSAEMTKSIASLVDSITAAATSLISAQENAFGLQIKEEMLQLKKRELDLKSLSGGNQSPTQQNIFVGSFGDLLKQINANKNDNLLDNIEKIN